jgi:hypothetical protein
MKTLTLIFLAFAPLKDFAQYLAHQNRTDVEIYGIEKYKRRKAVASVMNIVGASCIVSHFIHEDTYESNNLHRPGGMLSGNASILTLGQRVEFASLSRVGKASKDIREAPVIVVEMMKEDESEPMVYGLDQSKAANKTARVFDVLGASGIIGYFIWKGAQEKKTVDHLVSMEQVGEDYLLRIYAVRENVGRSSVLMNEMSTKLVQMIREIPKPAHKAPLYGGIGLLTVGVTIHISAIAGMSKRDKE